MTRDKRIRPAIHLAVSLLVILALAIGAPPAQAEPEAASQAPPRGIKITGRQYKAVKIGYQVQRANKPRWLNYKIAKQKFGPHTRWRRHYAAGWMSTGFRVLKMSARERRIVNKIKNRKMSKISTMAAARCTGSNGGFVKPGWRMQFHDYMNSCVSEDFQSALFTGGFGIGVAGSAMPTMRAKLWIGAVGVGLVGSSQWVRSAIAKSRVNAIIVKHNMVYIPGGAKVWYVIAPQ